MSLAARCSVAAVDLGFHFERSWMLFALILPLGLGIWVWLRRGRRLAMPFDHGVRPARRVLRTAVTLTESLLPVLLAVVVVIVAIPMVTGSPLQQRRLTNIEFCVDCSGSMTAQFGEGNRYDASMEAINEFLALRQGDAFGLTFFATDVVRWCPLTRDSSAFRCAIPFMKPDSQRAIGGGTMIGRALMYCRKVLRQQEDGDRMIILVSDGQSGDLMNGEDMAIGKQLYDDEVVVYGIHIGGGEIPPQITNLTGVTGGEAFVSGDVEGLKAIFRRIDAMEPAEIESVGVEYVEYYTPFCIAGLCLLGVWLCGSLSLRYTPW